MSGERDVAYDDTVYGVRRALDILDSRRPLIEVASAVVAGVIAVRDRDEALAQRDAARDIAARLEGECARLEAALREVVTVLGEHGEANHPAQLCALMALGEWDPDAVIAEGES